MATGIDESLPLEQRMQQLAQQQQQGQPNTGEDNGDDLETRMSNLAANQKSGADQKASFWSRFKPATLPKGYQPPPAMGFGGGNVGEAGIPAEYEGEVADSTKSVGKGVAKGAGETLNAIPKAVGHPIFDDSTLQANNDMESFGKGMEGIIEFMAGDALFTKGLSVAAKYQKIAKIAKELEEAPRLQKALEIGIKAIGQGGIQGAQTLAHGGDLEDAAKDAGKMALLSGGLGTFGAVLESGAKAGEKASKAADAMEYANKEAKIPGAQREALEDMRRAADRVSEAANSGGEVTDAMMDDLHNSHTKFGESLGELGRQPTSDLNAHVSAVLKSADAMKHPAYQAAVDAVKTAANGTKISVAGSELEKAANGILNAGEKLPTEVEKALKTMVPGVERSEGLAQIFASPRSGEVSDAATAAKPALEMGATDLVDLGERLRRIMRQLPKGDPNKANISSLIDGVDGTLEQLAQKTKASYDVIQGLRDARQSYKETINALSNPMVDKLREGNVVDAAKQAINPITLRDTVTALENTIGAKNPEQIRVVMGELGNNVFYNTLEGSLENGSGVNFSKLLKKWDSIPDATKDIFRRYQQPVLDEAGEVVRDSKGNKLGNFDVVDAAIRAIRGKDTFSKPGGALAHTAMVGSLLNGVRSGNLLMVVAGLGGEVVTHLGLGRMAAKALESQTVLRAGGAVLNAGSKVAEAGNKLSPASSAAAKKVVFEGARRVLGGN